MGRLFRIFLLYLQYKSINYLNMYEFMDVNNLEIGKLYIVKTAYGCHWLFRKTDNLHVASCTMSICLDENYIGHDCNRVCNDSEVVYIKPSNANYEAMWNRTFNENIEMV